MAVAIVPKFSKKDIELMMRDRLDRISQVIINRLIYIGEKFVKNARANADFTDRTGNLRNSIAYAVFKDGKMVGSNFEKSAQVRRVLKSGKNKGKQVTTKGSKEGVTAAKDLIQEIIRSYPKGYVLIVIAGMEYAAFVEAKGFDVITSSAIEAVKDLKQAIKDIKQKISKIKR